MASVESFSVVRFDRRVSKKRKLQKVPYVEMFDGKLQGVVSSGSDYTRVYCSWVEADTGDFYCATNNNRRCGGLRGYPCKHIDAMITNAIVQFGGDAVARFLGIEADPGSVRFARDVTSAISGSMRKEQASEVFSRFLNYLRYMEMNGSSEPLPEMSFFVTC